LGLIAGFIFGVAYVLIRRSVDQTLRQPSEVNFWTGLSVLGVIPSKSLVVSNNRFALLDKFGFSSSNRLAHGPATRGLLAEAFRTVLTSILFSGQGTSVPRVLALTSANASEGKTTVTVNLAISLAEIRLKVLIIDADLRRPRIHEIFDLNNDRGLSSLLNVETLRIEDIEDFVQSTSTPGIHVLPSGPLGPTGANLLHSPHLQSILTELKNKFDMILIDTPPATQLTDSRIVGKFSDAVILVTRAGCTTRESASTVVDRFMDDRTHLMGAILNDWKPKGRTQTPRYYDQYRRDMDSDTTALVKVQRP
jgi:capsular exopolysaccharide synthesis family protein